MTQDKKEIKKKIKEDEDFIHFPRLGNSLNNLLNVHQDGIDNSRIAKVLMITEEEVETLFNKAIKKLRKALKIKVRD